MQMKVKVARKHIEKGVCTSPQRCMIAAAIKDSDYTITYSAVRTNGITVTRKYKGGGGIRQHWAVPLAAARRIVKYDTGENIQPFSFIAKLIDETELPKLTAQQKAKNKEVMAARRQKLRDVGKPLKQYKQLPRVAGV